MRKKFRFFASVLALVTLFLCGCEESGKFVYKDSIENTYLIVDLPKNELSDNHLSWKLKTCDPTYYCFDSSILEFAVPKNFSGSGSWNLGKAQYVSVGKRNVVFLGKSVEAYLFHQKMGDQKNWFLYSKGKGLIGMGSLSGEKRFFYLIQGMCGFGSEDKC